MGKYTIVISGKGPHHNGSDDETDANVMAQRLVSDMKAVGHQIISAVFNTETTTDDLDALTRPVDPNPVSSAQGEGPVGEAGAGNGGPGAEAPKLFKFEAEGDTLYVQARDEDEARQTFKDRGFDDLPDELLTVTEVNELPEGEELLNPA